ncbi:MAG: hypothetical protein ASARMPRED_003220 [Alectoria sarmentosa]|nr:MAG: hypothetical protein ASARMPRED_003220 [Alectoria sarmentosa]
MPSEKEKPIRIPHATVLRPHYIKLKTFLRRKKQYTSLATAAFIFYPRKFNLLPRVQSGFVTYPGISSNPASKSQIEPARLLILQRSRTERRFPDPWEVPSGDAELTDPTILHSVARVTFEQTGLHLEKAVGQIGDGEALKTSKGRGFRLNFEIDITELAVVGELDCATLGHLEITLDKDEHQDFVWATEEDIRDEIYPIVTPEQTAVILQAFQLRRRYEKDFLAANAGKAVRKDRLAPNSGNCEPDTPIASIENARGEGNLVGDSGKNDDDDDENEEEGEEEEGEEEEEHEVEPNVVELTAEERLALNRGFVWVRRLITRG